MPTRLLIAYGVIGLMVIAAFVALAWFSARRRKERRIASGRRKKP